MRGRKPKPTALKLIQGNPGKRPLPKNEPKLQPAVPPCPPHLSRIARRQWEHVTAQLLGADILTALDGEAVALYCEAYARYISAQRRLAIYGMTLSSPNGYLLPSPHIAVANKAFDQMRQLLVEFGMTPSSRTRVTAAGRSDKAGPFDDV